MVVSVDSEDAKVVKVGSIIIRVDKRYFRPAEVETLLGDPKKAREKLGWIPQITIQETCSEMIKKDLSEAKRLVLLKHNEYELSITKE